MTLIHETQPVLTAGVALDKAHTAVILLHGRGARPQDILPLAQSLPTDGVAYLAPAAAGSTWYPRSGFGPLEANEPYLSSAINTITGLIEKVIDSGIPVERLFLGGFSQGACLMSEYVASHPKRYAGLFVLSGALMGSLDRERNYSGSLDGMPVFIGGMDQDTWVTPAQFDLTRDELTALGATVTMNIASGAAHTIRPAEVEHMRAMMQTVVD